MPFNKAEFYILSKDTDDGNLLQKLLRKVFSCDFGTWALFSHVEKIPGIHASLKICVQFYLS